MSPTGGYLQWDTRHFKEVMHLDGKSWTTSERWWRFGVQPSDDPFLMKTQTMAGTHVLQRPIYPVSSYLRTDMLITYAFQLGLTADDEDEYFNILAAKQSGTAIWFVPYMWVTERIRSATAGQEYKLWRPQAYYVAPEADDVHHAPVVTKDGVVDTNAVTFSGTGDQVAEIDESGDIVIRYCPAFQVVVRGLGRQVDNPNELICEAFQLDEVISP